MKYLKKFWIYQLMVIGFVLILTNTCKKDDSFQSVKIGTQIWMKENLNVSNYKNGDPIPEVADTSEWKNLTSGAWCYYENDPANGKVYGKLYNWYAVNDPRGLAPEGWHISTDAEWTALVGERTANNKLKEIGITHWQSPNTGATNETGFTALPGGSRSSYDGTFGYMGLNGLWWCSTEANTYDAWTRNMHYNSRTVIRTNYSKENGFSVRCVKDSSGK